MNKQFDTNLLVLLDVDPEEHDVFGRVDEDSGDELEEEDLSGGREHYEAVGKSQLRKPAQLVLGKRYEGASISRNALNGDDIEDGQDEDDDDDIVSGKDLDESDDDEIGNLDGEGDSDSEVDSDEAFGSGDEERFKGFSFRGSRQNGEKGGLSNGVKATDLESDEDGLDEDLEDLDVEDEDEAEESNEDLNMYEDTDESED